MNSEPTALNVKITRFEKTVKELIDIFSDNTIIPEHLQITLYELNDGYSGSTETLCENFIESAGRKNKGAYDLFRKVPISHSIENYPYPIVLLSDEQELDAETQRKVIRRHENGYKTFPVILLSDQFFRLTYGESFSYNDIIKVFEDSSNEKVMVFRRSRFQYLNEYLSFVKYLFLIFNYREIINKTKAFLEYEASENNKKLDDNDPISALTITSRINAVIQIYTELERIDKRLVDEIAEWEAEIANIREKCDRAVLEEITHVKTDTLSPFALNIDLKYAKLRSYLKDFLNLREMGKEYDFITQDLKRLADETAKSVSLNKARLSLIGTFSSGKTTLINTFLGKREIPLRTSMGHNTAVLMHLFHEQSAKEYYDIIYKDKLTWTVVRPVSVEKPIINKENESIRILNIDKTANGNYLIQYSLIKSKEQHSIRIRTRHGIAVKSGDVLKQGAPFTLIEKQSSAMVEICSAAQIRLMIGLLRTSKEALLKNTEKDITDRKKIQEILVRILSAASEKNSTKTYDQFCEEIGLNPDLVRLGSDQIKTSYSLRYLSVQFECLIGKKNERRILDRKSWIELCGDPTMNGDNGASVFSEKPECYMLAKELHLHINTEFLQYCSLTDTPGFGSVTEEHDAITERYIRDSSGRLLVMIAINAKTIDAKYQDLINSIDGIYNNFRKNDKKNVVFMLNCFTNLAAEANIKNQVEKVFQMLIGYGFNRNNIFVCNLKNALVEKQQMDTMYGYPSYKRFHDFIINEMISSDLTAKYRGIQSNWLRFFKDSKNRLDDQMYQLEKNLNNLQQYKIRLQDTMNKLQWYSFDEYPFNSDSISDEFDLMFDALIKSYMDTKRKKRSDEIEKAFGVVKSKLRDCDMDIVETISGYYDNCIRKISYYSESKISTPELEEPYESIAVLELIRLENLLEEADNETKIFFTSKKKERYSEKVYSLFRSGYNQTIKKAQDLCDSYRCSVINYKNSIIREIQGSLDSMKDEYTMRQRINDLKAIRQNFLALERRFNQIKFV